MLWLGTSNDRQGRLPDAELGHAVAARLIEEGTGEEVSVDVREIWPTEDLAGRVNGWLEEANPDLVFLKTAFFWFAYESVPQRVERLFGRVGRPVASLGHRAADNERVSTNAVFRQMRRLAQRTFGDDTPFQPDQVISCQTEVMLSVVRNESRTLVVSGPHAQASMNPGSRIQARTERRRRYVDEKLSAACRELWVPYWGIKGAVVADGVPLDEDGFHFERDTHADVGFHAAARFLTSLGYLPPTWEPKHLGR